MVLDTTPLLSASGRFVLGDEGAGGDPDDLFMSVWCLVYKR